MNTTMRAAVYYGKRDVRFEDVPVPTPGPGELLIRVTSVGICGTDAHEFDSGPHVFPGSEPHRSSGQSSPMIMGHEIAGRVAAVGDGVDGFALEELVVSGAGISCDICVQCKRGRTNLCENYWTIGLQRDGGLAEYVVCPASVCFSVEPYGLSEDLAGLAQPTAIAVHAADRARLTSDDQVVVMGAGGIGAFLIRAVADLASKVGVLDLNEERLKIAGKNGATYTKLVSDSFDIEETKKAWDIRPTVIFEVSGTQAGFDAARKWLEPGGRLVLVGIQHGSDDFDFRSLSLIEHEVIGTNAHVVVTDFPRALKLLGEGGAWQEIAPEILPLEEVVEFGLLPMVERRAERIKTLIDPRVATRRATNMKSLPAGSPRP